MHPGRIEAEEDGRRKAESGGHRKKGRDRGRKYERERERWKAKRVLNHAEREMDKNIRGKDGQKTKKTVQGTRNDLKKGKEVRERMDWGGKRSRK